ncbi:MAG: toll/interleukin-1 receptor domain-containing protein, partial [Rubrivivax sp.]|nr:toll/interleukin-1 receptor domain-containing protein [Rubrivivax sp.]
MTKLFISYSHRDEAKKNTLNKHLTVLTRAGVALDVWDDRRIQGGDDWRQEIRQAIEGCDIALLLISADFLISKFILDEEV